MFSHYVLRIYASQNTPVTPSCPVSGPILTILGVTFWHMRGGGGGYPRERQNDVLKHKIDLCAAPYSHQFSRPFYFRAFNFLATFSNQHTFAPI